MESHDEIGCEALEGPIPCANSCGFFGSAATMDMCSKCHKDIILKQEGAKLAISSMECLVNGKSSRTDKKEIVVTGVGFSNPEDDAAEDSSVLVGVVTPKGGRTNRCTGCGRHVGLTGFICRCGNLFCSVHRYSDEHVCPFDYRAAARSAIARANPVVKAEKLDKI